MTVYHYSALDARGRRRKGTLEGDSPRQVRQQLRERSLTPLDVQAVSQATSAPGQGNALQGGGLRLGIRDLVLLTRQLAALVQSGLPLDDALSVAARHSDRPRIRSLLLAVRSRVVEGHSLSHALRGHPRAFPAMYRATVAAGEESGKLATVLGHLADYTEQRHALRQKTLLALLYPALLTLVAIGIVTALLAYVVPQVVQVFDSLDNQLPLLTRLLIGGSEWLQRWGALGVLLLAVGGIVLAALLRRPGPRHAWHRLLLRLPGIGRLHRATEVARFTHTLGILTSSGVPLLQGLQLASEVMGNEILREGASQVAEWVREGSSLSGAMERAGIFSPMLVHLTASGEGGGNLDQMLLHAANVQERDIETTLSALVTLFEPLLILIMGGIVLAIVVAILLPVFELNTLIQ